MYYYVECCISMVNYSIRTDHHKLIMHLHTNILCFISHMTGTQQRVSCNSAHYKIQLKFTNFKSTLMLHIELIRNGKQSVTCFG